MFYPDEQDQIIEVDIMKQERELKTEDNVPWFLSTIVDEHDQYVYRNTGKDVDVFVLDTGVKLDHPIFSRSKGKTQTFYSFDGNDYGDNGVNVPVHGTAVSSCVVNVAKEANIFNLRFDMGRRSAIQAVEKMIEHKKNSKKPAILVNSFGGPFPIYEDEIQEMEKQGIILVAAAGNNSEDIKEKSMFPAERKRTLTVAASNRNWRLSRFSNYGKPVDIIAPGSDIKCANLQNSYSFMNGTSFAAPIVAGQVAKIMENRAVNDEKDAEQIKKQLKENASKNEITLFGKQKSTPNLFLNGLSD